MNPDQIAANHALEMAQQARKAGDKTLARKYVEQAANLAPELEEVWLMMAALASPRASIVFLEKALAINPQSTRARQGMHWAVERLRQDAHTTASMRKTTAPGAPRPGSPAGKSRFSYIAVLLTVACLVVVGAVWSVTPAAASFINNSLFTSEQNRPAWAPVDEAKPTQTLVPSPTLPAMDTTVPTATATASATATPTFTDTPFATATPSALPTETATEFAADAGPSPTPLPTDTDVPTLTPLPTGAAAAATQYIPPPVPGSNGNGGARWIDVDLTHQMVYAYEGNTLVNSFLVSTGTWQYPTVTGQYHIYVKYRYANMSGPGYYLPNVPYTMYFYKGYGLHGTYWHSNFGHPMSHGCVNLSIPDAGWLYNWASVGTLVNIHY